MRLEGGYWQNENALNKEAFAFFTGGKAKPGSELDLMYRRKFPNAYREYEDMLKKMGSGAEPVLVDGKLKGWKGVSIKAETDQIGKAVKIENINSGDKKYNSPISK